MKKTSMTFAAIGALALVGLATTMPAQARGGFGPGIAAGVIGGAVIAGAASSAYAYGPGYGYDSYDYAPGYYQSYGHRGPYAAYGVHDESQHGGQPSYTRP